MNRFRPFILAVLVLAAAFMAYGLFTLPRPQGVDAEGFSSERVVKDIEVMSKEHHSVAHPQERAKVREYHKGKSFFTERKRPRQLAEQIKEELEVVTPGIQTPVRRLSGGNVQKVLVGREIAAHPTVLMTAYAVRGLDINTSYTIYHLLNEQKMKGVAVIFVGEDLDVLLELSDRILVLCGGKITGIVDGRTATKEQVGMMMTGQNQILGGKA